jgi:hypothetical protein
VILRCHIKSNTREGVHRLMTDQTTEAGRRSGVWGKTLARHVAEEINAKMPPLQGKAPRGNFCLFTGKPAAIKTASFGKSTFLVYGQMLRATEITLFVTEFKPNNFIVYQIQSSRIRKIGRPALHQRHAGAYTVTVSAVKLIFYSANSQAIERTFKSALEKRLGTTFRMIS